MFDIKIFDGMKTEEKYNMMLSMLKSIIEDESDVITNISNATALINAIIGRINWCGFYFIRNGELVLGPFQGMPACTRIKIGNGVCGTAVRERKVMRIDNVHNFKGHIACDAASNSELVIPIIKNGKVYGVLDIDSEEAARFTELEQTYAEKSIELLSKYIDWEKLSQ
ncbi:MULTISPECIES: GAF domain-containing protein [Clostridium]|uniref:GAF domain-containing protein n=1 Tax=Clostridium TaxID=1485 RepID=UPI00069F8538|nr:MULTISPECIES: GAF domain-containing protein [Clostridium]KOF57581.1 diguanylate cyclase [Clostridium sp. DMHC 10]MCD2348915.1 GAF domain-containing protein [Clostridium guangxiense]